jgi:hypothetical protein
MRKIVVEFLQIDSRRKISKLVTTKKDHIPHFSPSNHRLSSNNNVIGCIQIKIESLRVVTRISSHLVIRAPLIHSMKHQNAKESQWQFEIEKLKEALSHN